MSLLSAELAATCSALGYYDEKTKKYYADENTLETVKDLIRYLRRDDENHDIRRQLGETKVLQTDLLPLLKSYWEETELFDVLLRLLVNLTTPPLILWNEETPTDKNVRNYFMQIEDHLQSYKLSFADDALWAVLSSRMSKILETDYSERSDDSSLIIERILVLIRNILYVPADPAIERRADNDANTHDQVSWAMHQSGLLDILLYISSSPNEQSYQMHILEILSHLLREQNASELGKTELHRNQAEKLKVEAELMAIRHKETIRKQQKSKIFTGVRHSRFGGTFVVKSMKAISDNDLIYHKPLSSLDALSFDAEKKKPKTPKNRLPIHMESTERRSAFSIRLFLKEFCVEFLNGAYNSIMYNVKDQLVRAKSQSHDASYYLWAIRFFMEFNRAYKFEMKLVSETMSVQTFHYVQQQMENYFDMMQSDKKKLRSWSRRLHIALLAYRELLLTLRFMDTSPDGTVRDSGKVIKSNIFYVLEYRELVLTLLVTFDELKMSDQYLKDLIETQHIFMRSFESFCKNGAVIVQKKSKSRKQKKKAVIALEIPEFNLDRQWDEASQQISSILESNSNIPTDIIPFDAASEVPIDDQRSETMVSIQRKLRRGEYENAIGLLRAAREVWPENDSFGSNNMSPEEEFFALRDIFMADLGENDVPVQQPIYDANDEEEDEEDDGVTFSESDLKFEDFVKRLAHPKIVRATSLALARFEENSVYTNTCIVKLMHRISFDCKMYVMMFQISLFMTFRKIYALKAMPEYKELVRFANFMLRQFFKLAETNKKIFMEALFWKSTKDAYDVEHGYGSYLESSKAAARAWTEDEEDEVRRLFMEHTEKQLEDDVVDWVTANLIDNTRTRRGVLKKLKELFLLTDYKGPKKVRNTSRLPQQWSIDEEEQLKELYEQFKDAMDPMGCIIDRLTVPRPKNRIIEKMLILGLIQDRKEVRKKRVKGARKSKSGKICEDSQYSEASSDSDGSDDGVSRRPTMSSNTMGGNTSSKPKHKKTVRKARSVINISSRRLAELALGIMQADMKEALEWLKESFSDAIEDFDDDTDEGIPLVPIMDYAVNAMDNNEFQNFLLGLGISKPFDEQETYWRIPGDMNLETMKSHEGLLTKVLEGTFTLPEEETAATEPVDQEQTNGDSTDDDIFDQLRKMRESNRDDEIDQEENANTEVEQLRKSKSNVLNGRDNDRPSASGVGAESENSDSEDEDIFAKLKRKTLVDSSEAFEDGPTEKATRNRKRRRLSSSDEQFDDGGDILAKAEEKLKNEKKKKKLSKKGGKNPNNDAKKKNTDIESKKKNTDIESKKKENNKSKSKVAANANFKSKEFISSDDDSGDDEESANKVKEHYEKLLQQDVQQNAERKAAKKITDRPESTDNDSDDNDSKEELNNKNTNDIQNDEQKESSEASEEETNYESNE